MRACLRMRELRTESDPGHGSVPRLFADRLEHAPHLPMITLPMPTRLTRLRHQAKIDIDNAIRPSKT